MNDDDPMTGAARSLDLGRAAVDLTMTSDRLPTFDRFLARHRIATILAADTTTRQVAQVLGELLWGTVWARHDADVRAWAHDPVTAGNLPDADPARFADAVAQLDVEDLTALSNLLTGLAATEAALGLSLLWQRAATLARRALAAAQIAARQTFPDDPEGA